MPDPEPSKRKLQIHIDADNAKCGICLSIWHDVVTVGPCMHNFCNGCFSEWLKRSKETHSKVLCPQCRGVTQFVGKNHFLQDIKEEIVRSDSSLKRSDEEIAQLNSNALIKTFMVFEAQKKRERKRRHVESDMMDEDYSAYLSNMIDPHYAAYLDEIYEFPCAQCGSEYNGFRCNGSTVHIECHGCGGQMPLRADSGVPQQCIGCDRSFCGDYWHSQGFDGNTLRVPCRPGVLKRISDHSISGIPPVAHETNQVEQDITDRCIRQMGRTIPDVISEFIGKLNNSEIGIPLTSCLYYRSSLRLNHAENITSSTYACEECYNKLVSFLLYLFRIDTPKHHLPADAANRTDCWYGYECRTQHHNQEHARRRNHVCRPTRSNR
ncbi:E3 ubiquitin-protein ligase CHFR [Linum perenne]